MLAIAESERDDDLRRDALQHLGHAGAEQELLRLYDRTDSVEDKRYILEGLHERGTTIVIVTHDPSKASRAERLIQMQDGQIRSELTGEHKQRAVQQFMAAARMGDDSPSAGPEAPSTREPEEFEQLRERIKVLETELGRLDPVSSLVEQEPA